MAHSFGKLSLPATAPLDGEAVTDKALDVLAEALPVIFEAWLGEAWAAVAPGEPLFRKVHKFNPEETEFSSVEVPALFIYSSDETTTRETDVHVMGERTIQVLWVFPNASYDKQSIRAPFLNGLRAAFKQLSQDERHPSWKRVGDEADQAAQAYGSSVTKHCGFDRWQPPTVRRTTFHVEVDGQPKVTYPAIIAAIPVVENATTDPVEFGASPAAIDIQQTTGGASPLTLPEHIRDPATP